jgi:hypothetical protein
MFGLVWYVDSSNHAFCVVARAEESFLAHMGENGNPVQKCTGFPKRAEGTTFVSFPLQFVHQPRERRY